MKHFFFLLLLFPTGLAAQNGTSVDQALLEALHLLYPKFDTSQEEEGLKSGLGKYYLDDFAKALEVTDINKEAEKKAEIQAAILLQKWQYKHYKNNLEFKVKSAELKGFYKENIHLFADPPTVSFIQANVLKKEAEVLDRAAEEIKKFEGNSATVPKKEGNGYTLNLERNIPLGINHPYREFLLNAEPNKVTGPIYPYGDNGGALFVIVTAMKKPEPAAFEQVKETCQTLYLKQIQAEHWKTLKVKALANSPITLSAAYFNYRNSGKQGITWGYIGETPIDNNFLENLQTCYPQFAFNRDSTTFKEALLDFFVLPHYLAEQNTTAPKGLEKALIHVLKNRLLAKQFPQNQPTVSQVEVVNFYQKNQKKFTQYGKASLLIAYLEKEGTATEKKGRDLLYASYKKHKGSLDQFKLKTEELILVFEENQSMEPNAFWSKFVGDTEPIEIVGPVTLPYKNRRCLILVTDRTPNVIRPIAAVQEEIHAILLQEKLAKMEQEIQIRTKQLAEQLKISH